VVSFGSSRFGLIQLADWLYLFIIYLEMIYRCSDNKLVYITNDILQYCQSHRFMGTIRRHWLIYHILLLYINRLSLSSTNKEKNDALIVVCSVTFFAFVYQNNENMIYYSSTIKGSLFIFFSLFLSLILLWFIKNVLVYSQPRLEQIAQTMVKWIPFKVHTDSYTHFYHYYFQ
jgi:hypothetical protein